MYAKGRNYSAKHRQQIELGREDYNTISMQKIN